VAGIGMLVTVRLLQRITKLHSNGCLARPFYFCRICESSFAVYTYENHPLRCRDSVMHAATLPATRLIQIVNRSWFAQRFIVCVR
jgi:hypothetical protein